MAAEKRKLEKPAKAEKPEKKDDAPAKKPATKRPAVTVPPAAKLSERAQRAVPEIAKLLHTGLTDWAVTDADTEAVHAILEALPRDDFLHVVRQLAMMREGAGSLYSKYLTRGVLDHSGQMQAKWSEQFDRKVYYESGAYKGFETLKKARDFEKEIAALVGATLWNQARMPPSQPLRGLLEQLRS